MSNSFTDRERNVLCLFDVDGTLTRARESITEEMVNTLSQLRKKVVVGFVGGSDLVKIVEQLEFNGNNVLEDYDYAFAENGLTAYKLGQPLPSDSFINYIGEARYKKLVNFILHYIADMDIPIKRGTFVEFRRGMVNVSPLGRNATLAERQEFERIDKKNGYRTKFIQILKENFPDYGLTYSIGGQISFDIFPTGWDKTYALTRLTDESFEEIHFFGDKTYEGGNDYELFIHPRTVGHSVTQPADTIQLLKELFLN